MPGTRIGGLKAAMTNKVRYGKDFYAKAGAKGGKNGRTGGFAAGDEGRERAKLSGMIGGKRSKRKWTPEECLAHGEMMKRRWAKKRTDDVQ